MICLSRTLFAAALLLAIVALDQHAQGDETAETSVERAASLARLTKVVESYSITMGDDRTEPLELVQNPVLRYSDAVSSVSDGVVFIWTKAGRPEAAMAVHPGTEGRKWIEFKSLSQDSLAAVRQGQTEWHPRTAGLDFAPVDGAPLPDQAAPKRLSQMRSLLRSFSASISDNKLGRQELRPLSQPIFRYSQPARGILDGGLFAFVLATNPELLLVVEAQLIDGKPQWMYSPARFTGRKSELRFNDQQVWPRGDLMSTKDPAAPFFQLRTLIPDGN
jgi:hypothetical protein